MPTREYYLQQAAVLLEMAAKMSVKVDAERLIARANEYQMLAEALPPDDPPPPPPASHSVTQPMQQQQQGTQDNEGVEKQRDNDRE